VEPRGLTVVTVLAIGAGEDEAGIVDQGTAYVAELMV
jgi:hypothetical protein